MTPKEAVEKYCFTGMTVLLPGFVNVGVSEVLIETLIEAGIKDIRVISNNTSVPHRGIGKLCSHQLLEQVHRHHREGDYQPQQAQGGRRYQRR